MAKQYETVIGLEVHVELATKTKIFCGCSTAFGGAPNTHTCPVCTGMPGSLPVLNKQVVEYAMAVGLALNCDINQYCKFDRKNYFYPDNPQNYQISQLYLPICINGHVEIETAGGKKNVGIHEIHMEEDASDCKLNEGSMRADVNLSVREVGASEFGTRTEMKNLNSFKAIARAIEGERARQIELLEDGEKVVQETRRWDDNKEYSYAMRSKEDAQDYRYFPDPDLTPIVISDEWIQKIKDSEPEFQEQKAARYEKEFDIPAYDISILTASKKMADLFEQTVSLGANPKKASNWLMGETMRLLKEKEMEPEDITFAPENLAKLIALADKGTINSTVAKEVFEVVFTENTDPEQYVKEHGLGTVSDEGALREAIEKIVEQNPQSVADYQAGKKKAIGFLVGQTMKAMQGKANPGMVNQILTEILDRK